MFTVDWFSVNIPRWQRLFDIHKWHDSKPKTVVEVGSFEGKSTVWCLENLLQHPDSKIYCLDTFEGSVEHDSEQKQGLYERFAENVLSRADADKVQVIKGESWRGLMQLCSAGVRADFVYVDGSHQAADVLEDLVLSYRIMKHGALMICDDYLWSNSEQRTYDALAAPKIAIDTFTTIYARRMQICSFQQLWQLALVKTD